jgi:hypothetical protein
VDTIYQWIQTQLTEETRASRQDREQIASRIMAEVNRVCQESARIQDSGDIEGWTKNLVKHRLQKCLKYYRLGSHRGRLALQSNLSAIVYKYINPRRARGTYQEKLNLIEDFLQSFYLECLNAFRRENNVAQDYSPRSLLQLAEYMSFCERYGKRRIPLPRNRSQQLVILRAQTFSQQQPLETNVDMDQAGDSYQNENEDWNDAIIHQLRSQMAQINEEQAIVKNNLRETVINKLIEYLQKKKQDDCANYFVLRLKDHSAREIEEILELNTRERDYLQQRFKYHLLRFALSSDWEIVHQWLGADLENNLGLTPSCWELFLKQLTPEEQQLLTLRQEGCNNHEISISLNLSKTQLEKRWLSLLEKAWELRNQSMA